MADICHIRQPTYPFTLSTMTQLVPVSYLYIFQEFIQKEYALDLNHRFQSAGCDLPDDPSEFVSFEFFGRVCEIALENVNDPVLGLKYGKHLNFTNHGALGAAIISCKNVSDVFDLLIRFESIRFPFKIKMHTKNSHVTFSIRYPSHFTPLIEFHTQCLLAGSIKLLNETVGCLHKDISIDFPHPEPEFIHDYHSALPVNLCFNKSEFAINIPNAYLEYLLPKHDEVAKNLFINMCENIESIIKLEQSLSGTVTGLLDSYKTYPSLQQISDALNVPGRTLRSHLKKEGTSYRKIIATHRINKSKELLIRTNDSIEKIAAALGYSDTANFNRAFKKETTLAPSIYRKQNTYR